MNPLRRLVARFVEAAPQRRDASVGLWPRRATAPATGRGPHGGLGDLGPALTVPAVQGSARCCGCCARRVSSRRATRSGWWVERTTPPSCWDAASGTWSAPGAAAHAPALSRLTERGVETVHDVGGDREADAWVVRRLRGRFPVRFERSAVIRQRIESERWHEIFDIERA
jgi:hypothetical protein